VLGGLFGDTSSETISKLPFLGDIPILGQFFKNKATSRRRDEVVFLIAAHIIEPSSP
jgi:type II secretory pathway component GspD/PulD (secretin)